MADTSLPPPPSASTFGGFIVALGASAGGLEALDRFFSSLQPTDEAAFVVIQHLAPEHKTMMDRLLARHTRMQVLVASEGQALVGGHVYVIPPGATMTVVEGCLRLAPRPTSGITLPIDAFFESLAAEAPSRAVGIVLSGTGSDGTRGSVALAEAGAWVMAQDPDTARFDGMPRNAAATGVLDQLLSPEALAEEVMTLLRQRRQEGGGAARPLPRRPGLAIDDVLQLLRSVMRIDFAQYKPTTLLRRVERRMAATGLATLQAYADHIASHPDEIDVLRRELVIPVTRFFRDPEAVDALREAALRPLVEAHLTAPDTPIRAWVAACATGEEAYSLAMLILDLAGENADRVQLKLFATDVEPAYLERASLGRYDPAQMAHVPKPLRDRWFLPAADGQWQTVPELRQRIVFSRHDLLVDPPFTQLDLVSCRNLLIYFRPVAQDRAVRRLSYGLKIGGVLFLGTSETPTAAAGDLEAIDAKQKLYRLRRRPPALPPDDLLQTGRLGRDREAVGGVRHDDNAGRPARLRALEALTERYAPAALLIGRERELLHVFGDARQLLSIRPGEATLDVLQLLPPTLTPVVATLLHAAMRERTVQRSRLVQVPLSADGDETAAYHLVVLPVDGEGGGRIDRLLLCLEPPAAAAAAAAAQPAAADLGTLHADQVADLERELMRTRANLQETIQELGTANEELQATNEELMAANEELQSTNEELQSVNEELHTVNAEFQAKIAELNEVNIDLESLTRSTRIPMVFLDADLLLTRFTLEATQLFRFREGDVGRPIADFRHDLEHPDLHAELADALRHATPRQREVRDHEGRYWLVTILPYPGRERRQTRLVLTCVDVSSLRDVRRLQSILDALPEHVAVLDPAGTIQLVNHSWRAYGQTNGDDGTGGCGPGINYLDVCRAAVDDDPHARAVLSGLAGVLDGSRPHFVMPYPCHSPTEQRWFVLHANPLAGGGCVVSHFELTGWIDPTTLTDRSSLETKP